MAEGANLTDDLRIDTRLANREIVPSAPRAESPLAEVAAGLGHALRAADEADAGLQAQNARKLALGKAGAESFGADQAITLGNSEFGPNFAPETSTGGLPADFKSRLDALSATKTGVEQGRIPQSALEAGYKNALSVIQSRYKGTPFENDAVEAFMARFGDTSYGKALAGARDARMAAEKRQADDNQADTDRAITAARNHGVMDDDPNQLDKGWQIIQHQTSLEDSKRQSEATNAALDTQRITGEIADANNKRSAAQGVSAIMGIGGVVYDNSLGHLSKAILALPPDEQQDAFIKALPDALVNIHALAASMRMAANGHQITDKEQLARIDEWEKQQIDSWNQFAEGNSKEVLQGVDLATKQFALSADQAVPAIAIIAKLRGTNAVSSIINGTDAMSPQLQGLFTKQLTQLVQEYQAGDRQGALATIVTLQQLKSGELKIADVDPNQAAVQNKAAQQSIPGAANDYLVRGGDSSTIVHYNEVAAYATMNLTGVPGATLKNLNQASSVLFSNNNLGALAKAAQDKTDPAGQQRASAVITQVRSSAAQVYTATLNNNGQNDTFHDNVTGAWEIKPTADGMGYQAVFNRATFAAWAKANPERTQMSTISAGMGGANPVYGALAASTLTTEQSESSTVPQSVKLKVQTLNAALKVLENPGLAFLDPNSNVPAGLSPKQLADHYIRGKAFPGQEVGSPSDVARKTVGELEKKVGTMSTDFTTQMEAADKEGEGAATYGKGEKLYGDMADEAAKSHGIASYAFRALIGTESGWNPNSVMTPDKEEAIWKAQGVRPAKGQHSTASGIMQFLDDTGRRFGLATREDKLDPKKAIPAGAAYYAEILKTVTPPGLEPTLADYEHAAALYKGEKHLDSKSTAVFEQYFKASRDARNEAEGNNS